MNAPIKTRSKARFEGYHAARWAEPAVMEMCCMLKCFILE